MTLKEVAQNIKDAQEPIILIYAFNGVGKTRLSVAYKDATKDSDDNHTGIYYNAYSEDLFSWDNGDQNDEGEIRLRVDHCSLSTLHTRFTEPDVLAKLKPYQPRYEFRFTTHDDAEQGIAYVRFFPVGSQENTPAIKISRGEERVFIWCFFLTLFERGELSTNQSAHFFIDDPVTSLDDHNLFLTASSIYDLIATSPNGRKMILTTHHFGLYSMLASRLTAGQLRPKYEGRCKFYILSERAGDYQLRVRNKDVVLYHLLLLQRLQEVVQGEILLFHFSLLRQALESVASFVGKGQFSYVLEKIDVADPNAVADKINAYSHNKVYQQQHGTLNENDQMLFKDVFSKLMDTYKFVLHA